MLVAVVVILVVVVLVVGVVVVLVLVVVVIKSIATVIIMDFSQVHLMHTIVLIIDKVSAYRCTRFVQSAGWGEGWGKTKPEPSSITSRTHIGRWPDYSSPHGICHCRTRDLISCRQSR